MEKYSSYASEITRVSNLNFYVGDNVALKK